MRLRNPSRAKSAVADSDVPTTVYKVAQRVDNLSLVLLDAGVVLVAWLLAFIAGFESNIPAEARSLGFLVLGTAMVVQLIVNRVAGLYGPVWRYASIEEATRVVVAVVAGSIIAGLCIAGIEVVSGVNLPMFTTPPVAGLLVLLGCGGIRFQARLFALERQRSRTDGCERALIVGAGSAGATLAYELTHSDSDSDVKIVGFVDDDPRLAGRSVRGLPVLGRTSVLDLLTRAYEIDRVLIALPHMAKDELKPVVDLALKTNAQVKVLSTGAESVSGPLLRSVRDLDVTDLLGREHAPVDSEDIAGYLTGSTVLITGAGGSVGTEIALQVARFGPERLLLLDRDESLLHEVMVGPLADAEAILLDIRDRDRVRELFDRHRPDVVFHAAANKHVPILERHPRQAVTTNVLGTWWLAEIAAESGCERFVHISTDKAADPCSVMGATKRAAEQVVFEVGRKHDLPFVAVRFGNVLGSRGSVVPTFLRQILAGGPVTVTNPEMTRYFMTIPEAVSLVLQSGAMATERRIYLLDMGEPASILGLARQMIRLAGLRPDDDIEICVVGSRPGERLHERLYDDAEVLEPGGHPSISALSPKVTWKWEDLVQTLRSLEDVCGQTDDRKVTQALEDMLRAGGVDCSLVVHDDELDSDTDPELDRREYLSTSAPLAILGGTPRFAPRAALRSSGSS